MTGSTAVPRSHVPDRPVLRRLADLLPPPEQGPAQPPPPVRPCPDPAASAQVERMLRAVVEVLDGRRPAGQLAALFRPELMTYLVALRSAAGPLKPRLRKVLTQRHSAGTVDAVALLTLSTGVRALAARFEQHLDGTHSRWRCTALQLRLTRGDLTAPRPPR